MTNEENTKMLLEHEVQIKLQAAILEFKTSDIYHRLEILDKKIDTKFDKLDSKFTRLYILIASVAIIPMYLKFMGWL